VLNAAQRKDLLEVLEDRYGTSSTIVTSQLEPKEWHSVIGDETIADAVCDRLVHNAHRVKLGGESIEMRLGTTHTRPLALRPQLTEGEARGLRHQGLLPVCRLCRGSLGAVATCRGT
jgi:hypothetical protein